MTTILCLLLIGFLVRRAYPRNKTARSHERWPIARSEHQGDAGEKLVHDELLQVLSWLCGANFYLHPTAVLLDHAPGTAFPTAEVDHLVITPFGIFVVETKHWTGEIAPGTDPGTVVRVGAGGQRETRRCPLRQNRSKVAFLRAALPASWAIEGLGVFSNETCFLSPNLPADLIRRPDLGQWLRERKYRHEAASLRDVNVNMAWRAIQSLRTPDPDGLAIARHCLRAQEKTQIPKNLS
ncbi:Nuclease-related domain-containing protein [Paraburkholderia fungorum]|uniref:Nuclease-related domain-containing protein n=1 Tax=Paraburkholderia fungorum TaxID=134537 RepID=A0A1H1JWI7_9BURK|nr:nuclease-related domain-containing protein [Paraburkholderia fungorum]SDR54403.1 Nuclease-related domain-containing protein [Paraburkholderia fungorum]